MFDAERLCIVDAPSLSAVTTNQGFRSGKVPGSVLVQAAALSTRLRGVGCNGSGVDAQLTRLLCRLLTNLPICRRVLSCVLSTVPVASPVFAGRAWHSCSGTAFPISACCATSQRCSVGGLERHLRLTATGTVWLDSTWPWPSSLSVPPVPNVSPYRPQLCRSPLP